MSTGGKRGTPTPWHLALPFDRASVPVARRRVGTELRGVGIPEPVADDAMLVLTELISNALRHARPLPSGTLEVHCDLSDDTVHIEVTDGGGPTRPRALDQPVTSLDGRGLAIVDDLSESWGVRTGKADTGDGVVTVYAHIPVAHE